MEFTDLTPKKEKALLLSVDTGDFDADASIKELSLLTESAGAEVEATLIQKRPAPDSATFVGKGKLKEAQLYCSNLNIDLIICDGELTPSQIRNIENFTDVRVVDRTQLILDIFASRAKSREGKLQVELAQMKYSLPRLTGKGVELSRLGGGIGTRGPGESKLESDRRHIMKRIRSLQGQIDEIEKRRGMLNKRREKDGIITVALVGYTNAGKSTLMNTLTDAGVLVEDKLFATLDPTSRKLILPDGQDVMLIDTVGFVSRLPHNLVEAFKSTLEEAAHANIILNVCDASDEKSTDHIEITNSILSELGCNGDNVITVLNKCDRAENIFDIVPFGKTVMISALKNINIDLLLNEIQKLLNTNMITVEMVIPYSEGASLNKLRENGKILCQGFEEDGTKIKITLPAQLAEQYKEYII